MERLKHAGYEHYEISNFALPNCRSHHNETYWRGHPYFAFGVGASRYVDGYREKNETSFERYLTAIRSQQSATVEREWISTEAAAREKLVFGLRRLDGVDCETFLAETGYVVEDLGGAALRHYCDQGWLEYDDGVLRLTSEGLLISDGMWPNLIVAEDAS